MSVAERVAALNADGCELIKLEDAVDDGVLARQLGEACRRSPQRLLVWQVSSSGGKQTPAERFFSFGFRRLFNCLESGCQHVLYEYRLADYKQPPAWLNSRYWAHPERFDLDPDELNTDSEVHP